MDMKKTDYDRIILILGDQKEKEALHIPHGYSELARQLTERANKKFPKSTVKEHTQIVFLSPTVLDGIDDGDIPFKSGAHISTLYRYPKTMAKVEKELLGGKLKTTQEVLEKVRQYKLDIEEKVKKATDKKRQEKKEKESKKDKEDGDIGVGADDDDINKVSEDKSDKPTPAEKILLKVFGKGKSLERKIEIAKEAGVDSDIVTKWQKIFNELKPIIFLSRLDHKHWVIDRKYEMPRRELSSAELFDLKKKYKREMEKKWVDDFQEEVDEEINKKLECWEEALNTAREDVTEKLEQIQDKLDEAQQEDEDLDDFRNDLGDMDFGLDELEKIEIPDPVAETNKMIVALIEYRDKLEEGQ